jgi:hypothetical protein
MACVLYSYGGGGGKLEGVRAGGTWTVDGV